MKIMRLITLLMMTVLIATGCGRKTPDVSGNDASETASSATEEQQYVDVSEVGGQLYTEGLQLQSLQAIEAYLVGEWHCYNSPEDNEYCILRFLERGQRRSLFIRLSDGAQCEGPVDYRRHFLTGEDAAPDVIHLRYENIPSSFTPENNQYVPQTESGTDLYMKSAFVDGEELLSLRELGNGESWLGYALLGYERRTASGSWLIRRTSTNRQLNQTPFTGETFYAYLWKVNGDTNTAFLQRVMPYDVMYEAEEGAGEVPMIMLRDDGYAEAPPYAYTEGLFDTSERYPLTAGIATVDENGTVTAWQELTHRALGIYEKP